MIGIDTVLSRPREVVTLAVTLVVLGVIAVRVERTGAALAAVAAFVVGILALAPREIVIEWHYWYIPAVAFLVLGAYRLGG